MAKIDTYKIKTDDIDAVTIEDAQDEICAKYADDIEWLSGVLNIAGGDLVEAIATHIVMEDEDWTPCQMGRGEVLI